MKNHLTKFNSHLKIKILSELRIELKSEKEAESKTK
jgi:hypothetical protein